MSCLNEPLQQTTCLPHSWTASAKRPRTFSRNSSDRRPTSLTYPYPVDHGGARLTRRPNDSARRPAPYNQRVHPNRKHRQRRSRIRPSVRLNRIRTISMIPLLPVSLHHQPKRTSRHAHSRQGWTDRCSHQDPNQPDALVAQGLSRPATTKPLHCTHPNLMKQTRQMVIPVPDQAVSRSFTQRNCDIPSTPCRVVDVDQPSSVGLETAQQVPSQIGNQSYAAGS